MTITLNGTTGITTPDITSTAGFDSADLTGDIAAARITDALNATGSAPLYACRAWVNFDGTTNTGGNCDIRASGNVSSVTDNGTGDYTVNFMTAMPDANYASISRGSITSAAGSGNLDDDHVISRSLTTLNVRLECSNSAAVKVNFAEVYVAIFR